MAKKAEENVVKEVQERDGSAAELEAYLAYRASGHNSKGYHEPTRDQEPDVAPEYGIAPAPDLFNPRPPESVPLDIARPADNSRQSYAVDASLAAPLEEKEENADEFFANEVRPNVELTGADEDGNLPEQSGLPADVSKVAVVDEKGEVKS